MIYKHLKNKKGLAMLEAMPIIWVMFILLGVTLGSWGVVHTAILNSIAARNYSFFLFNNRYDLSYLRDFGHDNYNLPGGANDISNRYYREDDGKGHGKRFSYITGFSTDTTTRRVDFRNPTYEDKSLFLKNSEHSDIYNQIFNINKKKVGPAWLMVGYGICLSAVCGDN